MAFVREEVRRAVEAGDRDALRWGCTLSPWDYYPELVRTIREEAWRLGSDLHVKAFTAVEIVHLAKIAKVFKAGDRKAGIRWVLNELKQAGLGSLPGGAGFRRPRTTKRSRERSGRMWARRGTAWRMNWACRPTRRFCTGISRNSAMRLVHYMDMLRRAGRGAERPVRGRARRRGRNARRLADTPGVAQNRWRWPSSRTAGVSGGTRSGYFQTIIPLPFFPTVPELEHLPGPGGLENLRTLAVARLMLDNFPHVKAF